MKNEHVKIFSGSSIIVNRLKSLLDEQNISSLIKDNINLSKVSGFGPLGQSIDLFVLNSDVEKAKPIVDKYNEQINS